MSYRVDYGAGGQRTVLAEQKKGRAWAVIGSALVLGAVALALWPEGRAWVMELLLPGDPAVTGAALETLVEDLKQGTELGEAVTAFCREIVSHGA